MAVQTMGLDYSWLVDLAKLIAAARQQQPAQPVAVPNRGALAGAIDTHQEYGLPSAPSSPYQPSGVAFESPEEVAMYERRRAEQAAPPSSEHEIAMQKLVNEGALAQAISQERGGTEQAKIAGAATVAANQKTTADKAKETIDVLMKMTPEGQMEALNAMEAKDAEAGGGTPSGGTISSPGKPPITLPGSTKGANPNSPLTWIKDTYGVDARTVIANLQPKTVAAGAQKTAANLLDDFQKLVIKGDLNTMLTLLTGEQGATQVTDALQQFGESNGYPQEVIDDVKATITGLAPTSKGEAGNEVAPPEGLGLLSGAIGATLHPETPKSQAFVEQIKAGAPGLEQSKKEFEARQKMLTDYLKKVFTLKVVGKKEPIKLAGLGEVIHPTGVPTTPTAVKVGPTVDDAVADMKTWDTKTIKAFQKRAGIKEDGKMSPALVNAMKDYFEKHKEEWR